LDDEVDGSTFSRDGRQLILICESRSLRIYAVSDAQLIKVIHLIGDRQGRFNFLGITADGRHVVCMEYHGMNQTNHHVYLRDVHADGSIQFCVCQNGELVSKKGISPIDDLIAVMTRNGVIKLARRVRDMTCTIEVVADGKCFDMTNGMSFSTKRSTARASTCRRGLKLGRNQGEMSPNDCQRSTLDAGIFA
jgi:hypothetical protein